MPVYVDNMRAQYGRMIMCHMVADSIDELHAMADKIGLQRKWLQDKSIPHYDVSLSKKKIALSFGAIEITSKELVTKFRKKGGEINGNPKEIKSKVKQE